jgi:hypothetical protein
LNADEAKIIDIFAKYCKENYANFGLMRELFGYPNDRSKNTIQETTKADRIREISHEYFTSNGFISHIISGKQKFHNKLKLI